MRQERKQADSFDTWQHLVTSVAANASDLAHLEVPRLKLEGMLKEVKDLTASQAALTASKQEASKRIEDLVISGRKVATVLKVAVKEHYCSLRTMPRGNGSMYWYKPHLLPGNAGQASRR